MKRYYWGENAKLWHDSKCIVSVGGAPLEVVKQYIQSQAGGIASLLSGVRRPRSRLAIPPHRVDGWETRETVVIKLAFKFQLKLEPIFHHEMYCCIHHLIT